MTEKPDISWMFNASGNLTSEAMQKYLAGQLSDNERLVFEKHSAESEFDKEAMDGLRSLKHKRQLVDDIHALNQSIRARVRQESSKVRRINQYWLYAAAASIILILGIVAILNIQPFRQKNLISRAEKMQFDSLEKMVQPENQEEITIAQVPENRSAGEKEEVQQPEPDYQIVIEPETGSAGKQPEIPVTPIAQIEELTGQGFAGEKKQMPVISADAIAEANPVEANKIEDDIVSDDVVVDEEIAMEGVETKAVELQVGGVAMKKSFSGKQRGGESKEEQIDVEIDTIENMAVNEPDSGTVFMVVEAMPEYPGGDTALMKYLQNNLTYPEAAKESGVQGKVFVSFIIEKDGSLSDAIILRGLGYGCDQEALRVVQDMPAWKPGQQRGKPIRVRFNLPVEFVIP